ncbi:MAG: 50S ribosomal protein L3 [Bifidobacteriaceae bacterium]|jgi:large subunit ribosomal protein L3|nr:50S ribosomal protein L3 [Bifidobacteriaceae bacterium]
MSEPKINTARKSIMGEKLGMTQIWNEAGFFVPVSVVKVGTNVVIRVLTRETDGYDAVQIAYGEVDPVKISQAVRGHFNKAGVTPRRFISEFRTDDARKFKVGQELGVDTFALGQLLDVSGTTKGKGFAGTMKRHGFHGVSASHGAHLNHRKPGSVGAAATPSRIFKGLRMSGRMGGVKKTTQNLVLAGIDEKLGYLLIKGAIPGSKGGIVMVSTAVKATDS